jgi:hypothetical protein
MIHKNNLKKIISFKIVKEKVQAVPINLNKDTEKIMNNKNMDIKIMLILKIRINTRITNIAIEELKI